MNNVIDRLDDDAGGGYDIIHYSGHVVFDKLDPQRHALVLHDKDLTVKMIKSALALRPPVLAFINGCESAGGDPAEPGTVADRKAFDQMGLARCFLETGAYFLGSRAKVVDDTGKNFAAAFYRKFLEEGEPLGAAVLAARRACLDADDLGWASYVLYGDPRLVLKSSPT